MMEQSHLESLISSASIPELKDLIRKIPSCSRAGKDTISNLLGRYQSNQLHDISVLQDIVLQACQQLGEAKNMILEALSDLRIEPKLLSQRLLQDSDQEQDIGYESTRSSSLEVLEVPSLSKKRKFKRKPETVPRSEPKRTKSSQDSVSMQSSIVNPQKVPEPKTKSQKSSIEIRHPPQSQKQSHKQSQERKKIDNLFAADAARRVKEEQEEIARVEEIRASIIPVANGPVDSDIGLAKCARCTQFYRTGENTHESCIFHPGFRRKYDRRAHVTSYKWSCCGRSLEGCRQAKHIDIQKPGAEEMVSRLRTKAEGEAAAVTFCPCFVCRRDVEVKGKEEEYRLADVKCTAFPWEAEKVTVPCSASCGRGVRIFPEYLRDENYCEWCQGWEVADLGGGLGQDQSDSEDSWRSPREQDPGELEDVGEESDGIQR